ncbi:hypothetical protein GCM10010174_83470 [Kutzneria viridogrisea]
MPSQVGEQPPPLGARMNASWNAFWPVAAMTTVGSGGLLLCGIRYGADAYQLLLSAAGAAAEPGSAFAAVVATAATPPVTAIAAKAAAASLARCICPPRAGMVAGGAVDCAPGRTVITALCLCQVFRNVD